MSTGNKLLIGCMAVVLGLVATPMFLVLMYFIVNSLNPPVWVWVLYWCYVPTAFLTTIMSRIMESMSKDSE